MTSSALTRPGQRDRVTIKFGEIDSHIKTDLTIREGQKLVLGKIRLLNDIDLFLVLTTKVY